MLRLFIVFLLVSCSHITELDIPVKSLEVKTGEVVLLDIPLPEYDYKGVKFFCRKENGRKYYYTADFSSSKLTVYISQSYFWKSKTRSCFLESKEKEKLIARINVLDKKFPSERLYVNKRRVNLSEKDQKRASEEQLMLNKLYKDTSSSPLFKTPFIVPLKSKITSIYGARRVFNNNKKTQHLGTDFRAPTGTKIPVTNDGRVVFAGDLFYTGLTVIVDHGLGILTNYGHLSKLLVQAGDKVLKRDIVGLSGSTGRSSGPHLHWGVKVNGMYIDGIEFTKLTK